MRWVALLVLILDGTTVTTSTFLNAGSWADGMRGSQYSHSSTNFKVRCWHLAS